jgi:hypothetical protein
MIGRVVVAQFTTVLAETDLARPFNKLIGPIPMPRI